LYSSQGIHTKSYLRCECYGQFAQATATNVSVCISVNMQTNSIAGTFL